jgi:hypothetical protein
MIALGRDFVSVARWLPTFPRLAILLTVLSITWWAIGSGTPSTPGHLTAPRGRAEFSCKENAGGAHSPNAPILTRRPAGHRSR